MADNSNTLTLTLQIKEDGSVVIDQVHKKIGDLETKTTSGGKSITQTLGGIKAGYFAVAGGVAAAIGIIDKFLDAASEAEVIESRLAFQAQAVGYNFQEIKPYVDDFADSVMRATRFSDEMARQGLGQMLQYTPDVEKGMQGVRLAMDMATQTGQDLGSTTRYVGMAMNGNVEILGRWIPELRDLESKVGANATAAEKWAYTQGILNEKFGGAAQADLRTYAGQVAQLKNQFGETQEKVGKGLLPFAQNWIAGVKLILASGKLFDQESLTGKILNIIPSVALINKALGAMKFNIEESEEGDKAVQEAKRKAAEQALNARAKAQYDLELSMKGDIEKLDVEYQKRFFQLANDKIGMIRLERDEAIRAAQEKYKGIFTAETAIEKIKDFYYEKERKQIEENKNIQMDAMLSLATMWKGYYDDRIGKENEIINLVKGLGIGTTIGAKFEFAGVEEQFRKITEQAAKTPTFTEEDLEKLKAEYIKKIQGILPYEGGTWEEIPVPTGKDTWGTDYRWKEGIMTEEQRRTEAMREESMRRIETMGAGVTGERPEDILSTFDQTRQKALELQQEIQKIQDIKFSVESGKLVETINQARDLGKELQRLSEGTWEVNIRINTDEATRNIEQLLADRWVDKRSVLRSVVESPTGKLDFSK